MHWDRDTLLKEITTTGESSTTTQLQKTRVEQRDQCNTEANSQRVGSCGLFRGHSWHEEASVGITKERIPQAEELPVAPKWLVLGLSHECSWVSRLEMERRLGEHV